MNHNQEAASALSGLFGALSRLSWLVADAAGHAQAGANLPLLGQRLDEIGDVLADAKSFHNSAKAANARQADTPPMAETVTTSMASTSSGQAPTGPTPPTRSTSSPAKHPKGGA